LHASANRDSGNGLEARPKGKGRVSSAVKDEQTRGGVEVPELLEVRIEDSSDGASVVALAGELDLSTIPRMAAPLREQLGQRRAVLVDLSSLTFIDSSGISVLIEAFQTADGTPMSVLVSPDSAVERVFGIAGIAHALPVHTDREQALAALNGSRADGDPAG
jgi:anti-sigma B factor antagonist